jgi:glycerol-3-phosphate dehydrogenase
VLSQQHLAGAIVRESETGREYTIRAKAVINPRGVFSDSVRRMDEPDAKSVIAASQGAHAVLPKAFLPGDTAIMVPQTSDGRVLFAVPWHDCVVVGTTDTAVDNIELEPRPMDEEIGFILTNASKYLSKRPSRSDVLSVFAGLRPLVKVGDAKSTAALSRDHTILISNSGLLTIAGGKWTTYRKMAQDAVEQAETMAGFDERQCKTEHLQIHGWAKQRIPETNLRVYGADAPAIKEVAAADPALVEKIHPELPYIGG